MVSKKKKQKSPKQKNKSLQIKNKKDEILQQNIPTLVKNKKNKSQQINKKNQNTKPCPQNQPSILICFLKENLIILGLFGLICIVACCYLLFAQQDQQPPICQLIKENATSASFIIDGTPWQFNTKNQFNIYQISNLTLNKKNVTLYANCQDVLNLKNEPNFANLSVDGIKSAKRIYLITEKNNPSEGLIPLFEFGSFCANGEYRYLNATCSIEADTELIKLANKSSGTFVIIYATLKNTGIDVSKENIIAFSSDDLRKLEIFNNYLIYKILGFV